MVRILLLHCWCGCRYLLFLIGFIVFFSNVQAQTSECDTTKNKVMCAIMDSTGYVLEIHRFKDGEKSGSWERFNYNGELIEKNYYKKGIRVWTFFYRDGEVIKSINKKGKVKTFRGCGCG